jgi:hypothetical protein
MSFVVARYVARSRPAHRPQDPQPVRSVSAMNATGSSVYTDSSNALCTMDTSLQESSLHPFTVCNDQKGIIMHMHRLAIAGTGWQHVENNCLPSHYDYHRDRASSRIAA